MSGQKQSGFRREMSCYFVTPSALVGAIMLISLSGPGQREQTASNVAYTG